MKLPHFILAALMLLPLPAFGRGEAKSIDDLLTKPVDDQLAKHLPVSDEEIARKTVSVTKEADPWKYLHETTVTGFIGVMGQFGLRRFDVLVYRNEMVAENNLGGGYPRLRMYAPGRVHEREQWWLVGKVHEAEPVVYVSENNDVTLTHAPAPETGRPAEDKKQNEASLRGTGTRKLNRFERHAMERLRKGEDVVRLEDRRAVWMMGAIRADQTCLRCHDGAAGDLLGAFTYAYATKADDSDLVRSRMKSPETEWQRAYLAGTLPGYWPQKLRRTEGVTPAQRMQQEMLTTWVESELEEIGLITGEMLERRRAERMAALHRPESWTKEPVADWKGVMDEYFDRYRGHMDTLAKYLPASLPEVAAEARSISEAKERWRFLHEDAVTGFLGVQRDFPQAQRFLLTYRNVMVVSTSLGGSVPDSFVQSEDADYVLRSSTLIGGVKEAEPLVQGPGPGWLAHAPVTHGGEYNPVNYLGGWYLPQASRQVNDFERYALSQLQKGDEVVVLERPHALWMVGAVRASDSCLRCHQGKAGDLLGAFTYAYARTAHDERGKKEFARDVELRQVDRASEFLAGRQPDFRPFYWWSLKAGSNAEAKLKARKAKEAKQGLTAKEYGELTYDVMTDLKEIGVITDEMLVQQREWREGVLANTASWALEPTVDWEKRIKTYFGTKAKPTRSVAGAE